MSSRPTRLTINSNSNMHLPHNNNNRQEINNNDRYTTPPASQHLDQPPHLPRHRHRTATDQTAPVKHHLRMQDHRSRLRLITINSNSNNSIHSCSNSNNSN